LEEARIKQAAEEALKEAEVGTTPKVAPKPPWRQKYPQTTLERMRQKAQEEHEMKARKKSTSSSSKGTSSSSRVIEVVETATPKDSGQLKKMKQSHPRLKPVMRGRSEIFIRSRSFWLGKTRKVVVEDDEEKKPSKKKKQDAVRKEERKSEVDEKPETKTPVKENDPVLPKKNSGGGIQLESRKIVCIEEC
jgi:hypothetical protein